MAQSIHTAVRRTSTIAVSVLAATGLALGAANTATAQPAQSGTSHIAADHCGYHHHSIVAHWGNCSNHKQSVEAAYKNAGPGPSVGYIFFCARPGQDVDAQQKAAGSGYVYLVTKVANGCGS